MPRKFKGAVEIFCRLPRYEGLPGSFKYTLRKENSCVGVGVGVRFGRVCALCVCACRSTDYYVIGGVCWSETTTLIDEVRVWIRMYYNILSRLARYVIHLIISW